MNDEQSAYRYAVAVRRTWREAADSPARCEITLVPISESGMWMEDHGTGRLTLPIDAEQGRDFAVGSVVVLALTVEAEATSYRRLRREGSDG